MHWTATRFALMGSPLLLVGLTACHATQVTHQYSFGFDQAIAELHEHHVLHNISRCDHGEFFIQMRFSNFGSDVTRMANVSAELQFFDTDESDGQTQLNVNVFDQSFTPAFGASQSSRLGFVATPAEHQREVFELYSREVNKVPEERFFIVTRNPAAASKAYCAFRRRLEAFYIVPEDRKRQFRAFMHRVYLHVVEDNPIGKP